MSSPQSSSGARDLVAALEVARVEVCFGLPGVHNLPIWAALEMSPIRLVGVRHEQTAAYAADGYARASGRPGVALTTTGPGAANTLGAVGEAYASGSPVVVIATDIPTTLRRPGVLRGVLHETRDQGAMFAPVVKAVIRVGQVADLPAAVGGALALALQPPSGPVYVEIPTDLLSAEGADPGVGLLDPATATPRAPDRSSVDRAAELLRAAERPLVWAGGGAVASGAGAVVADLAELLGAPVLETYAARGIVSPAHPASVGLPPHVPAAGALWDEADAVVAVGTDFDGMMTQNWSMPQPQRLVALNVNAEVASQAYPADVTLAGDARLALEALTGVLRRSGGARPPWAGDLAGPRDEALARLAAEDPASAALLASLEAAAGSAKIVCDMCIPGYWVGGFHRFREPRKLAYPVGWGTLGFAFPASLGAALADEAPTLCVCGDGGFMFACGELATAVQEQIPLCILLVDDGGYGMLRFDQEQSGLPSSGVNLLTPDWLAFGRSFGLDVEEVEDPGEPLAAALSRRLGAAAPSMIVLRSVMLPPPTTSPRWYRKAAGRHVQGALPA